MPVIEYHQGQKFPGVAGRTADESSPACSVPKRAAKDTPNVLFIVLDDTGFGQLGCFGSPIDTPNLDSIAANGLRYNNMHTTALCSPSRSCIITGRNHHSNNMACVTEFATGFPGYDGNVPFENGFLSEILLGEGFNTYMVGKWHLIPSSQESEPAPTPVAAGPRLRALLRFPWRRHKPVASRPGRTTTTRLTARHPRAGLPPDSGPRGQGGRLHRYNAKQVDPNKPFYLHFCPGGPCPPSRADGVGPTATPGSSTRDGTLPARRPPLRQKELGIVPADCESPVTTPTCRSGTRSPTTSAASTPGRLKVFAGFLSHTDHHIGRLIEFSCAPSTSSTTRSSWWCPTTVPAPRAA